jgi:hypothetical protein
MSKYFRGTLSKIAAAFTALALGAGLVLAAGAGQITSAGPARILQGTLKFMF